MNNIETLRRKLHLADTEEDRNICNTLIVLASEYQMLYDDQRGGGLNYYESEYFTTLEWRLNDLVMELDPEHRIQFNMNTRSDVLEIFVITSDNELIPITF